MPAIEVNKQPFVRKFARIQHSRITLINKYLHIQHTNFTLLLPLHNTLKPCFSRCKSIGFSTQKLCFCLIKAQILPSKSYAFNFQTFILAKINAQFSSRIEMLIVQENENKQHPALHPIAPKIHKIDQSSLIFSHPGTKPTIYPQQSTGQSFADCSQNHKMRSSPESRRPKNIFHKKLVTLCG